MADAAILEGSLLDGAMEGGESVRSIVLTIRSLSSSVRRESEHLGNFSEKFGRIQNPYTERSGSDDDAGDLMQKLATCEEQIQRRGFAPPD